MKEDHVIHLPSYSYETKRNAEVRWNEHNNSIRISEPSKHFCSIISHCFTWTVISNALKKC